MAVYELVLEGAVNDQPCLNVLHYDVTGSTDLQALTDRIAVLMVAEWETLLVPGYLLPQVTWRLDEPGQIGVPYQFTGGPINGQDVDTEVWQTVALNVQKLTTTGSRPAKGRIFQGAVPSGAVDPLGRVDVAFRAAVKSFWDSMVTIAFDTVGIAQMVIKASNPTAPNTVPYNPVSSTLVSSKPAKQSRRNVGT